MTKLLFGTTSLMVKTISESYFPDKKFHHLYFADNFNAWPNNPASSNPFHRFQEFAEIVRTNDRRNPYFIGHRAGVRTAIKKYISDLNKRKEARKAVTLMSTNGLKPYLAILEWDTYHSNPSHSSDRLDRWPIRVPQDKAASPTSIEYLVETIDKDRDGLHLQALCY